MGIRGKRLAFILACLGSLNSVALGARKGDMKQTAGSVSSTSPRKQSFSLSKNRKSSVKNSSLLGRTSNMRKIRQSADSKVQLQKSVKNLSENQNIRSNGLPVGKVVVIAGIPMVLLPTGSGFGLYFFGKNLGKKLGKTIGEAASREQIKGEILQSMRTIFFNDESDFESFLKLIELITLADWKYATLENGVLRLDFKSLDSAPFFPIHGAQFVAEENKISFDVSTWDGFECSMNVESNIGNSFTGTSEEVIKKVIPCIMAKSVDKRLNMKLSDSAVRILETMFRAKIKPGLKY